MLSIEQITMKKRGQIAIFVILGISVIILVGFIGYTQSNLTQKKVSSEIKETSKTPTEIAPIKKYAESCLKDVSDRALWLVGEYGGYIDPEGNDTYGEPGTLDYTIYNQEPYPYYIGGTPLTVGDIEGKLSKYIIIEFEKCFNLTTFEDNGFFIKGPSINYQAINFNFNDVEVDSNVTINEDSVTVKIEYPMNITKRSFKATLKDFRADLPIRLGKIFNAVNSTPEGLLPKITDEWGDGDEDNYDLTTFNCDSHDPLKQINIYSKDHDPDKKIIKVIDYKPYYSKYLKAYVFQFAIRGEDPIKFEGNMCSGDP